MAYNVRQTNKLARPQGTMARFTMKGESMGRIGLMRLLAGRIRVQGLGNAIAHVARHPDRLMVHGRRLMRGDTGGLSNRYSASDRVDDMRWVGKVASASAERVRSAFDALDADHAFSQDLREHYAQNRPDWAESFHFGRFRAIYAIVRLLAPALVIETGVHDGLSSSLILKALEDNRRGRLVSVDLPSADLPVTSRGPGWLVPDRMRHRWKLQLGDARSILPRVCAEHAPIDLFLHDSDHSVAHRRFELTTVKPHLARHGVILCDDDSPGDGLAATLASSWDMLYVPPNGVVGVGAIRPNARGPGASSRFPALGSADD